MASYGPNVTRAMAFSWTPASVTYVLVRGREDSEPRLAVFGHTGTKLAVERALLALAMVGALPMPLPQTSWSH